MPDLAKVSPGQGLVIPAADYNAMIDAARAEKNRRGAGQASGPLTFLGDPANLVLVRNDTGSSQADSLDPFAVLTTGDPLVSVPDHPHDVRRRPAFAGLTPTAGTDQPLVTIDPLAPGQIGRAVASGVAVCRLTVTDTSHQFARPAAGDTETLHSSTAGPARILSPVAGTGPQWAVVLIGLAAGTDEFFVEVTGGSDATGYSGKRSVLTAANTWTDATGPAPLTFTNNIWRARSNVASPALPPIAAGQLVRVWPSPTYGPVSGVPQYECLPWGAQQLFTGDVVTDVYCDPAGSLVVVKKTLTIRARDLVASLEGGVVTHGGDPVVTHGGDPIVIH